MGRNRTVVLIAAAVLVVGGLLAAVVRVNDAREDLAAQQLPTTPPRANLDAPAA